MATSEMNVIMEFDSDTNPPVGSNILPYPVGATPKNAIVVNSTSDGYELSPHIPGDGDVNGPEGATVIGNIVTWADEVGVEIADSGLSFPSVDGVFIRKTTDGIPSLVSIPMLKGSILYATEDNEIATLLPAAAGWMLTMGDDGLPAWAPSTP